MSPYSTTPKPARAAFPRFSLASFGASHPVPVFFSITLLLALFLVNMELVPLPEVFYYDARLVEILAADFLSASLNENEALSYLRAAQFFRAFEPISPWGVALVVGTFYVITAYRIASDPISAFVATFFLLPAVLLSLPYPQKDTLSCLGAILVIAVWMRTHSTVALFTALTITYALIAVYVRSYYALILCVVIAIYLLQHGCLEIKVALVGILALSIIFVWSGLLGDDYLYPQQHREFANLHRMLSAAEGNRTAFVNPLPPDRFSHFVLNYAYSFVLLNVPIIKWPDGKSLYMTFYCSCVAVVVVIGLRSHFVHVRVFSGLAAAHVFVLCLFDPDVGSYLRHVSTSSIYLTPIIAQHFRSDSTRAYRVRYFGSPQR